MDCNDYTVYMHTPGEHYFLCPLYLTYVAKDFPTWNAVEFCIRCPLCLTRSSNLSHRPIGSDICTQSRLKDAAIENAKGSLAVSLCLTQDSMEAKDCKCGFSIM